MPATVKNNNKIVITGAAGLVGINLITVLRDHNFTEIVALDKNQTNLHVLKTFHPHVNTICVDLADPGSWENHFQDARGVVLLHAQITANSAEPFIRNNVVATTNVLAASKRQAVPYLVHVSSSVVNSVAEDHYTRTKKLQEELVKTSGIKHCILRPTLMFGWFDAKHLGWLSRFMDKAPVFPIPGHGRYMRQPLYARDFCRVVLNCIETEPAGEVFDLVGADQIDFIDIIRTMKRVKGIKKPIMRIPYPLFYLLLWSYGLIIGRPPFTVDQLKALTAGDRFRGVDMEAVFKVRPTPFEDAIEETLHHPQYSTVVLQFEK
jgi:nucleoside-diphosphate-sugar epimerase